jgi:hypothetical protein
MNKGLRALTRHVLPATARHAIRGRVSAWQVQRAIEPLRAKGSFTADELRRFHAAWPGEGFSADVTYLSELLKLIERFPGDVLECGTGATTLVAGVLAERSQTHVFSLEQESAWAIAARRVMRRNAIRRVRIFDAPLKSFGDYAWYDTSGLSLPRYFGVVICDGPFIAHTVPEPHHSAWRYGVLAYVKTSATGFGALLLDDVNDPRAAAMLERWRTQYGATCDVIRARDGLAGVIRGDSFT